MIGKFYRSFDKKEDETQELPQEVVDILNKQLPSNFMYIRDESGRYKAVPRPETITDEIKLTTQFGFNEENDAEILEKLKRIPREKWSEYFYRTQMKVPIINTRIGDKKKLIPIEELSRDPLSDGEIFLTDSFMQADAFPEPFKITFESPEGDLAEISIQQQAYDSLMEIKFINVDFLALKIELYQFSPLVESSGEEAYTSNTNQLVVKYSVTPTKADSVKEAVTALHIFRGLFYGTTKVDGHIISHEGGKGKFDPKQIEDALNFWETSLLLEEKLNVTFDPKADCPEEDIRFFNELKTCLLDGKVIVWRHPFDHFQMGGFHMAQERMTLEEVIGRDSVRYEFLEGPIPAKLLGTEFNLYSRTEMNDLIVTNVEWDNEKTGTADIYISDVPDKQWTLTRLYMTETDMEDYRKKLEEGKHETEL